MPAGCSLSDRLSIRNASITISCVAEAVATKTAAANTTDQGDSAGSQKGSSTIDRISSSCENKSQARRLPNSGDSTGISNAATTGAHRKLMVSGVPAQATTP